MPSFSKSEVVLVRYPFSDLTAAKVRPAVIVGVFERSPDYLIVPLTSHTDLGSGSRRNPRNFSGIALRCAASAGSV